jgi:hypothetical protein
MSRTTRFPTRLYIRNDQDSGGLLVVGQDDDVRTLDVDDGQQVASYELVTVNTYRTEPRLDPVRRVKRGKSPMGQSPRR